MHTTQTYSSGQVTSQCRDTPASLIEALEAINDIRAPLSEPATKAILEGLSQFDQELLAFEKFNTNTYARNRIFCNEWVDILLLCWRSGQRTPLHDHAGSRCGVYVLKGEGSEVHFKKSGIGLLVPEQTEILKAKEISVSYDSEIHMLGNFSSSKEDLVTLHCYSPPLSGMNIYDQSQTLFSDYSNILSEAANSGCYNVQSELDSTTSSGQSKDS